MHDFVVRRLNEYRQRDWQEIADATSVPIATLKKVARRAYKSHRLCTMEPLAAHLGYFEQFGKRKAS